MLVGPAKALFMNEISSGLDSSTTYQIVMSLDQSVHVLDRTMVVSFLQPVALLDDLILLSEGIIVYQGLCKLALEVFESMGVHQRKGLLTSCKR
jgi:ABC-type multidrug transport system ATPase subunit